MKELRTQIAVTIKKERELKKLSQADLAIKAGLSIATIKRMEDTVQWPGLKQYVTVCQALGIGLISYP